MTGEEDSGCPATGRRKLNPSLHILHEKLITMLKIVKYYSRDCRFTSIMQSEFNK